MEFWEFLKDFYIATTPFYVRVILILMALVFPIQTAVAHYRKNLLKPHEAVLAILGTVLVIQFYFMLKSYSVFVKPVPFEMIEGPLWGAYILPMVEWLKRFPPVFRGLDIFYLFVWGISCGVSVVALFTERRESLVFFLALALCYLASGVIYILIRGISPYYVFGDHFIFLKDLAPLSHALHESSRRVTELLGQGLGIRRVIAAVGYPFQPIAAFPSFHVAYAYLVSFFLAEFLPNGFRSLGYVFVGGMTISALLLGFHWISDVAVGLFMGWASIRMVSFLFLCTGAAKKLFP